MNRCLGTCKSVYVGLIPPAASNSGDCRTRRAVWRQMTPSSSGRRTSLGARPHKSCNSSPVCLPRRGGRVAGITPLLTGQCTAPSPKNAVIGGLRLCQDPGPAELPDIVLEDSILIGRHHDYPTVVQVVVFLPGDVQLKQARHSDFLSRHGMPCRPGGPAARHVIDDRGRGTRPYFGPVCGAFGKFCRTGPWPALAELYRTTPKADSRTGLRRRVPAR